MESAIDRVLAGPERKTRVMSDQEKRVIAYHEGGHTLVGHVLEGTDPIHKVSIVSRAGRSGWTLALPTEDKYLKTRSELVDTMTMLLGGRTAEELVFGDLTTGASDDIERCTEIARAMVTTYGMSDRLGPQQLGTKSGEVFLGKDYGHEATYSDEIAGLIDDEVRRLIDHAHDRARFILTTHRARSTGWPRRWSRRRRSTTPTWPRCSATSTRAPASRCRSTSSSAHPGRCAPRGRRVVTVAEAAGQPRPGPRRRRPAEPGWRRVLRRWRGLRPRPRPSGTWRARRTMSDEWPSREFPPSTPRWTSSASPRRSGRSSRPSARTPTATACATPPRVARMYAEVCSGLHEEADTHLAVTFEAGHDEMVMVRDIAVQSVCEHHIIPFIGKAHVAYIPGKDGRITGLSKLARLVDAYARRPQVQERLTAQVADEIDRTLHPGA